MSNNRELSKRGLSKLQFEESLKSEQNVFRREPSFDLFETSNSSQVAHFFFTGESGEATIELIGGRNIITVGKEAKCSLLLCCEGKEGQNSIVEILVKEDATVEAVLITTNSTNCETRIYCDQAKNSTFKCYVATTESAKITNNIKCVQEGEHAKSEIFGVTLLDDDSSVSNRTIMAHLKEHGYSNQLFRSVVGGRSSSSFGGVIYVALDAQQIEAYQQSNNILLSDEAKVQNMPQLEIYADDVKCSHGSTTGQLDSEALFYMRQRGIPEKEAKKLQIVGFVSEIFEGIESNTLKEKLEESIIKGKF